MGRRDNPHTTRPHASRSVTCEEDRASDWADHAPQVLASFRDVAHDPLCHPSRFALAAVGLADFG